MNTKELKSVVENAGTAIKVVCHHMNLNLLAHHVVIT